MSAYTIIVSSEGQALDQVLILIQVDIHREVNRLPYAKLVVQDGNAAQQEFALSNTDYFEPGKEISINIRYEGESEPVLLFRGIVLKHELEATHDTSLLSIELGHEAFKLSTTRQNVVYREKTDQQIIQEIIENHGLTYAGDVSTEPAYAEQIQYYCTDWDFLLSRAESNGLWVILNDTAVHLVNPVDVERTEADHLIRYGIDELFEFRLEADASHQVQQIESRAWNNITQAQSELAVATDFSAWDVSLNPTAIASAIGNGHIELQNPGVLLAEELQNWSDAMMQKSRFSMIRGYFTIPGKSDVQLLHILDIQGIGDKFNGKAIITGVRHRITVGGWCTDIQVGLDAAWFAHRQEIADPQAAALLPAIHGLQIGKVETFEEDPEEQFRVRVRLPSLGEDSGVVWARMASFDAGNGRGWFSRPEPEDEVVLGFLNDDPRQAIILGALYSQNQAPGIAAEQVNEDNFLKGYFSREGIHLQVDEENKAIELRTSDQQVIALNEADKSIEITDVNGNQVILNDKGITIKSAKDLNFEATGNVTIKGKKVDVQ